MAGVAAGSEQASGPTTKKHQDEETQGLEKVTDYVEEQENSAELGQVTTDDDTSDPLPCQLKRVGGLRTRCLIRELCEVYVLSFSGSIEYCK